MTPQISAPDCNVDILDSTAIQKIIPHRPPFLLIDEIIELQPGKRAVATKNVTVDEWFFQGHFPGYPIMPGVLIIEALAQAGAAVILSLPEHAGKIVLFARIDKVKFKREVKPGDKLLLEVDITRWRGKIGKGLAQATVNGEAVAEAELTFAVK